ncbi:hypothetical protein [Sinanaerobacter sp. ZZT-01]|uniref:hypothetical protein n=1 Tax=Sinanaerobacter sp. ZZT-01 TaxID=3111540 RepID=UPI002D788D3D|nr:hypothetical protein [Sinanaerobacter sp. ZZT-01]WRR94208.1 hypothetical protein U5921_03555 [Sinanaerobacter sp. ZZT-01]
MRKIASELDNVSLLQRYTNISQSIEHIIPKINFQELREFKPSDLPTFTQDKYAGTYAEILCRMGENEENIAVALRANPLLKYKNGEELYFCKDKCKVCNKEFYPQDLQDGICTKCQKTKR